MRDLIDGEAELNEEEDDESFDEETGESRARDKNAMLDDSSEEDEDDDDEEEARRVCLLPCSRAVAFCSLRETLTRIHHRFGKVSLSMRMKRRKRLKTRTNASVAGKRSVAVSARRKSNLTRRI
jgi:hypothetical protein